MDRVLRRTIILAHVAGDPTTQRETVPPFLRLALIDPSRIKERCREGDVLAVLAPTRADHDLASHAQRVRRVGVIPLLPVGMAQRKNSRVSLWVSVRAAVVECLFEAVVESPRLQRLPPMLRAALVAACLTEPAHRSVGALARQVACDRTTLYDQWRRHLGNPTGGATLGDLLDGILLLRVAARKPDRVGWRDLASRRVVPSPGRLRRIAQQLAGVPLTSIAGIGMPNVLGAVEYRLLKGLW